MNQNQIGDMEQKLFMSLEKARHSLAKTHQIQIQHHIQDCHGFALMSEYQNKFVYVANKWNTLILYIIKRLFLIEKLTITSMYIQVSTPFHHGKSLSLYNIKSS